MRFPLDDLDLEQDETERGDALERALEGRLVRQFAS